MKERWTKRLTDGSVEYENGEYVIRLYQGNEHCYSEEQKAILKLAEYEDLEQQGLIVRLPGKVGDKVYIVFSPFGEIDEWEITSIQIFENKILFRLGHKGTDDYAAIWSVELGGRAFLTYAEAEKKLKELKGVLNE